MTITRQELIDGLQTPEPADQVCREALEAGAGFQVSDRQVRLAELILIYGRRVRRLNSIGTATVGADRLLGRLTASNIDCVRLGGVYSEVWTFTLFLHYDQSVVLASFGVAEAAAHPD